VMTMDNDTYYRQVDLAVYRQELDAFLPPVVLDFHAHTWLKRQIRQPPWEAGVPGGNYMIVNTEYGTEALAADGQRFFPGRRYEAVCFGYPAPSADLGACNSYCSVAGQHGGFYPLMLVARDCPTKEVLRQQILDGGFFGYKVVLPWYGDDYGDVTVEDMLSDVAMEVAHELQLVIMLHLPRSLRLADPLNIASLRRLSAAYPAAQIVVAHAGRSYCASTMRDGIGPLRNLPNVYFEVSMVQEPLVIQVLLDHVDSQRVFFGTDLPVAAMRGRRVCINNRWVDVVREPDQGSAFRVSSASLPATFMVYEIARAVRDGALLAGLSSAQLAAIFYDNGMAALGRVAGGRQLAKSRAQV
jgi:uncharacterized protein